MPYEIVRNDVMQAKTQLEFAREPLIVGRVQATMGPVVEKTGALSSEFAFNLPDIRAALVEMVPVQAALVEAFAGYIAAHDKEKLDIWAARDLKLEPGKGLTPVALAVWDSGVDTRIFKGQVVRDGDRPDILFVAAAGNADNDAMFNEFIPSSIRLPNLLTAGAVDKAGDEAPFTSYGPTVVVHANGYEVDGCIPGGDRLKLSGTSMASPDVANPAAKILAVNPKLKPAEVIEIIRKTAEKSQDGRRFLIYPAHAISAARR